MATVSLYNAQGKENGKIELSDAVFGVPVKQNVVHEVYTAIRANARQPWAHTKNKSEVRGGGRKPWRQKGTGRARHGSIRSPLWTGGGVTFGPRSTRNFTKKINRKKSQSAVRMCLTDKVLEKKLFVLDALTSEDGKTKAFVALREAFPESYKSTLVVLPKTDEMVLRATGNIPKLDVVRAQDVNVVDLMHHQYIFVSKDSVDALVARLAK
ncbi:MAG: 50S ribosomal protein L4 [Candidatus Magasanikbacteria bacterium]|jgi:large subunit ribosomal protein L4|nr:50S ribosomal protein L4 [Candidatus Magasanikbacteria bacterium]MBT4220786.1 50S ribosomal protein L4 [Candidatus Magasanikbacteria bacterium]MBT4350131.1 50S ribosomal protein L4 [Candidatus Magasanikbacteria bacterium]MBT4541426.1 50S ribosomal protein L4 [Candidatus Magasanikbacteria bacterium]MBT6253134.1 50S ribosomal protein L4 [Candidatus Magasanikbacteria bacterium]